jgi:tetratricopeptide (TPR) repeat protein
MKKVSVLYLLGLLVLASSFAPAQSQSVFEKGKEAYKEENYQQAIDNWSQILENGEHSAALYFNLGNAHYKLNNIGASIYYYEKAKQLDPYDADIKNNLAFAQNARIDVIEPLPQTVFRTWYKNVSGVFDYNGWAINAVVFAFIFVALFLSYYYANSERRKRLLFAMSAAIMFFLVASVVLAFLTYSDHQKDNPAIIYSEEVEIRDAPTLGGEVNFILHEGTKVQLLEKEGDWVRIQLSDGKDGWMPFEDLKAL